MLYLNRKEAWRIAKRAVERGLAWSFDIRFRKRAGKASWDVEQGWEVILRDVNGRRV